MTGAASGSSAGSSAYLGPGARLLASALENVDNAVMITDVDGVISWVNPAFTRMSGFTADEAVGSTPRILKSEAQDTDHYTRLWKTILDGEVWRGQVVEQHKDGHHYTVMQTIIPIVDTQDRVEHFVAVHQDVTDRRRAEADLWLQARLLDAVGDAVIATDLDGAVQFMNPAAEELFGWREADAIGRPVTDVNVPGMARAEAEEIMTAVRRGETWTGQFEVARRDGSTFTALVTNAPYYDANGLLAGIIGVSRDITDLRSTIDELERSEQIRVAFLRATSHELRTPLSIIVGFVDILRRHDAELTPDERSLYLDRLAANADRLIRLITDLLDLDRLSTGLVTANREAHDLTELVTRVVDELDPNGRRIEFDLAPVTAEVDAPKIERVVANLVANAVRHTPPDGRVRVALARQGTEIVLRVDDDGPGIDEAYLPLIFQPFVQGPEHHDDPNPSSGLGLSLATEMVRLHGGTITASNLAERGARFEVRLPDQP